MEIARKLPKPTSEQNKRFAEYVAQARNWYKIIPASPQVAFFFYLDPDAGRYWVRKTSQLGLNLDSEIDTDAIEDSEVVFEDAVESHQWQRGWETTEEYRSLFGFWNFNTPYMPQTEILMDSGDIVITAGAGCRIRSGIGWCKIPRELKAAGTAWVSSLMYPFSYGYSHFAEGLVFVEVSASDPLNQLLQHILELKSLRKKESSDWSNTDEFKKLEQKIEEPLTHERNRLIGEMVFAMERFLQKLE